MKFLQHWLFPLALAFSIFLSLVAENGQVRFKLIILSVIIILPISSLIACWDKWKTRKAALYLVLSHLAVGMLVIAGGGVLGPSGMWLVWTFFWGFIVHKMPIQNSLDAY